MESDFRLKDFTDIYALCLKRADSFSIIGDHFCQIFQGRDIFSICLTLVAAYQECESVIFVTHRLIIIYLIYRLKDIGCFGSAESRLCEATRAGEESSTATEICSHPLLLIFVKIYDDFRRSTQNRANDKENDTKHRGIIQLLGHFPKITPQEAHFVRRILTESTNALSTLFRLSPAHVADNPISASDFDISEHLQYVEAQLEQFRVFGRESVQNGVIDVKRSTNGNLPIMDQTLLSYYARIVYSLVPPPFVRIEPCVMPPCEDEFRFIYPSLIQPEQVQDEWLKNEEWNQDRMRPLEKTQTGAIRVTLRASAPSSPAGHRKQHFVAEGGNIGYGASPVIFETALSHNLSKYFAARHTTSPGIAYSNNSSSFTKISNNNFAHVGGGATNNTSNSNFSIDTTLMATALLSRTNAVDALRKIFAGDESGSILSKSEMNRLLLTVSEDPLIFRDVNAEKFFSKLVDTYPDLAAELLFFELSEDEKCLSSHFDELLNAPFTVQGLVTVNKFISSCEYKHIGIPNDFLNRFITYCIASCEQKNNVNSLLTHRLVRLVCMFFTALLRLKSFDLKPRLPEIQNFAIVFLTLKEASTLYQTILQL